MYSAFRMLTSEEKLKIKTLFIRITLPLFILNLFYYLIIGRLDSEFFSITFIFYVIGLAFLIFIKYRNNEIPSFFLDKFIVSIVLITPAIIVFVYFAFTFFKYWGLIPK